MDYWIRFLLLCAGIVAVSSEAMYECPLGWVQFEEHCYHFVFYPDYPHLEASAACQMNGAYLVSVNTDQEHDFVSRWLTQNDQNKANQWWTSGAGVPPEMKWEGDGTYVPSKPEMWANEEEQTSTANGPRIVYTYTVVTGSFLWGRQVASTKLSYVCEISLSEAYRVIQQDRDHMFGTNITDPTLIIYGPRLIQQPKSILVVEPATTAVIECDAESNPQSSYKWFYNPKGRTEVNEVVSGEWHTLTNGKLTIQSPQESRDTGAYQCLASNQIGAIFSNPVSLNFGYLLEFSNDPPGQVVAKQYQGVAIDCTIPSYNPRVDIKWYKAFEGPNFLRTDLHPYLFVSNNGKLYFSETSQYDAGDYHCFVTLIAPVGQEISTTVRPSRTSLANKLVVQGSMPLDYGPEIHNDFPAVFPTPALRGEELIIECFAYGKLPLIYTWSRDNGPVPGKAQFLDHNRMLILPDAQLEDSGNYTCKVERENRASAEKTIRLTIEARPFFIFPLKDQHVDINRQLTWRCEALGVPKPVYSWYKDGKRLTNVIGDIEIQTNILVIKEARPEKHQGMYQCSATNIHGTTFTSAQLRVLAFKPTFDKRPVNPSQFGTIGGSVTILCQPEAAPAPEIKWMKDNRDLPISEDPDGRITQVANGNLLIRDIQLSDQGTYTCIATNNMGSTSSSGLLTVIDRTVISIVPIDTRVDVNSTAFLTCEASYDVKGHDLVYVWDLHGRIIDPNIMPHYMFGTKSSIKGLYIVNAQLYHAGRYRCSATTVDDFVSHSAYLDVHGPPSECGRMRGEVSGRNVTLTWFAGAANGAQITAFHIEFNTDFNEKWRVMRQNVPISEVIDMTGVVERLTLFFGGLKPGTSYRFRVIALNRYGAGPPSQPSVLYKIPDAAPVVPVTGIRPYWGPVGTLPIEWDPLDRENLTGSGVGYMVYYRKKDDKGDTQWSKEEIKGRVNRFPALVGADHYFLEYEVKVGAFNSLGFGPNSSVHVIMSAEDMPVGASEGVYADGYNATAMMVYWKPIPNTREFIRGHILGYQVNYWKMSAKDDGVDSANIYCDCGEGLLIGLDPNEDYEIDVQVFTAAGLGPVSGVGYGSTYIFPPLNYPEYVHVSSYRGNAVFVTWRGISTGLLEEPLIGYKIRWWPATENIRKANDTVIPQRIHHGVVHGIASGVVYALRVLGYSNGGDGKKSPTIYFTLEGQVMINPETTEIMNSCPSAHRISRCYYIFTFLALCFIYWLTGSHS